MTMKPPTPPKRPRLRPIGNGFVRCPCGREWPMGAKAVACPCGRTIPAGKKKQ